MDSTLMSDLLVSSDDDTENDSHYPGAVVVSSTVSETLFGLCIKQPDKLKAVPSSVSRINSCASLDNDILIVDLDEDDEKFLNKALGIEHHTEDTQSNSKRKHKSAEQEPETLPASQPKRVKVEHDENNNTINYQPVPVKKPKKQRWGPIKSPLSSPQPIDMAVQLSEISSSTRMNAATAEGRDDRPIRMSGLFHTSPMKKIAKYLGDPCTNVLSGECTAENCIQRHELVKAESLRKRLDKMSIDAVRVTLHAHVCPFDRLMEQYFCTFAEYFADNDHMVDLIEMIPLCNEPRNASKPYYVHIIDGLVKLGMTYSHALDLIVNCPGEWTEQTMLVLSELITNERNDDVIRFLMHLKRFNDRQFGFNAAIINRMMAIGLSRPYNENWFTFVRKLVNGSRVCDLDLDLVQEFCAMTPRRAQIMQKRNNYANPR